MEAPKQHQQLLHIVKSPVPYQSIIHYSESSSGTTSINYYCRPYGAFWSHNILIILCCQVNIRYLEVVLIPPKLSAVVGTTPVMMVANSSSTEVNVVIHTKAPRTR